MYYEVVDHQICEDIFKIKIRNYYNGRCSLTQHVRERYNFHYWIFSKFSIKFEGNDV